MPPLERVLTLPYALYVNRRTDLAGGIEHVSTEPLPNVGTIAEAWGEARNRARQHRHHNADTEAWPDNSPTNEYAYFWGRADGERAFLYTVNRVI